MNQKIIDALQVVFDLALQENDKNVASAISSLQGAVCMGEEFEEMYAQMGRDFSQNMIDLIHQSGH